jgi:hypothetical protein
MTLQATPARSRLRVVVLWAIMASVLYGASYQQFLFFSTARARTAGLSDSKSYLAMSHGNYDVPMEVQRYRAVIPSLASLVQKALGSSVKDSEERDKLSFFIVNFIFSLATAILLEGILGRMGFKWEMSLLGAIFFLTSRINVMSVGAPIVESLYFFSIAVIVYLTLSERFVLLVVLAPLLILSKETILPFLFLPFAKQNMRNWKMVASVVVALGVFYAFREFVVPAGTVDASTSLWTIIYKHFVGFEASFRKLARPQGIHDLLNGFSLLAVIAVAGLVLDRRSASPRIPSFLLLVVFISFALALLSGNMGRMMFAAYVPVFAYALIAIEHFCSPARVNVVVGGDRCLSSVEPGRAEHHAKPLGGGTDL